MTDPGTGGVTSPLSRVCFGVSTYKYCLTSCAGIVDPAASEPTPVEYIPPLISCTDHPSTHSNAMRSNVMGFCVRFWMWTSRKTFCRSAVESRALGDFGTWTLVFTDSGFVT